ncbi:MAG: lactate utilization protein, partial [Rhodoferax sp.]|nr:lactate utilization protein [Rhodoferax sp.]
VARLRQALEAVKTEVHDVTDADWVSVVLGIAATKGLRHILIGQGTEHGEALARQAPTNLQIVRYERAIEAWQTQLFDGIDAGLTLARGALAQTGSLILWPTPAEPRLMSLVPSLHFVLLDANTIHADFHAAMTVENWADRMPTNALLICGPSKTADIQQTLAYGAHGPRELVVLIWHGHGHGGAA